MAQPPHNPQGPYDPHNPYQPYGRQAPESPGPAPSGPGMHPSAPAGAPAYAEPAYAAPAPTTRLSGVRLFVLGYMALGGVVLIAMLFLGFKNWSKLTGPPISQSQAARYLPPGVPLYPGFTRVVHFQRNWRASRSGSGNTQTMTTMISFRCRDKLSSVAPWYQQALSRQGWTSRELGIRPQGYAFQRGGTTIMLTETPFGGTNHLIMMSILSDRLAIPPGPVPSPRPYAPSPPSAPTPPAAPPAPPGSLPFPATPISYSATSPASAP